MNKTKKRTYTRIALVLSICLLIMWALLGTGTSLAWFTDTTPDQRNIFNIGDLDLKVSYRPYDKSIDYTEIDATTNIFDDEALYEPGYVQVVYLKVENKGDIPFDYKTAVSVADYTTATNCFGHEFNLQDYLRFGVITADSESELDTLVKDRITAASKTNLEFADKPLNSYTSKTQSLNVDGEAFMALIVRMPEDVNNVANYRGDIQPMVKLGLIVKATQQGAPIS